MLDKFQKSKKEIQDMTEDEFFKYMDELDKYTETKRNKLYEEKMPHFTSVEEIKEYYNGITFKKYEQKKLQICEQSTKVFDKFVTEAIDEYNKSFKSQIVESKMNVHTTIINGIDYIVVDMSYDDFVKSQNGKDMDDIQWT